jgi:hypothetical protein
MCSKDLRANERFGPIAIPWRFSEPAATALGARPQIVLEFGRAKDSQLFTIVYEKASQS